MLEGRLDRPPPFTLLFGVLGSVIGLAWVVGAVVQWTSGGDLMIGAAFAGDDARRWQRGERAAIRVDPGDYATSIWIGAAEPKSAKMGE